MILALNMLSTGCSHYAINSREEVQSRNPMLLERTERYETKNVSLNGSTLVVLLDRTCEEHYRVDEQRLRIEEVRYDTFDAWVATMSISAVGLLLAAPGLGIAGMIQEDDANSSFCGDPFFEPNCDPQEELRKAESLQDAAIGVAVGSAALGLVSAAILLIVDNSTYENEVVLEQTSGETVEQIACSGRFPSGGASLHASAIGERFEGEVADNGRVEIDLTSAPAGFWTTVGALQIELPGKKEWVPLELPNDVKTAGLERFGEVTLALTLTFDDARGNSSGRLDAGETAALAYAITNNGQSTAKDVQLELAISEVRGLTVDSPVQIGSIAPGEMVQGSTALIADAEVQTGLAVIDGTVRDSDGASLPTRLRLDVDAFKEAERVFVINESSKKYKDLLAAGTTRLQSVLTETRRYAFVTDDETRKRITSMTDKGGGSPEDRRKRAIQAARQENISKVFQYSIVPLVGTQVQLVLTVYDTASGDQIFLKDAPADVEDAYKALEAFETLARAYLDWTRKP